ncbi:MAG: TIGR02453 family protein [Gemmatimonadota bacterium]|nr:MAG: TIGR02453 family protein [Gemmatimonadota bacterium]
MASAPHFSPRLFRFLKDLAANNDRAWFQENKPRYENDVKEPLLAFIAAFAGPLGRISPHFLADPRPTGGSMFRIYRDTRFAKDKTPYKTSASAQFRHAAGKNAHAPCYYLHLEPGSVFVGAGIWRPDTQGAAMIRDAILQDPAGWKKIVNAKKFRESVELQGDSLKRPPRGVDKEHPLLEDLKRKDFIAVQSFTEKDACSPDFLKRMAGVGKTTAPFVKFVTEAMGLEF